MPSPSTGVSGEAGFCQIKVHPRKCGNTSLLQFSALALPNTHYHIRKHKFVVCGLCEPHSDTDPARVEEVAKTHNVAVLQSSHYLQLTVLHGGGAGRGGAHFVDKGAEQKVLCSNPNMMRLWKRGRGGDGAMRRLYQKQWYTAQQRMVVCVVI